MVNIQIYDYPFNVLESNYLSHASCSLSSFFIIQQRYYLYCSNSPLYHPYPLVSIAFKLRHSYTYIQVPFFYSCLCHVSTVEFSLHIYPLHIQFSNGVACGGLVTFFALSPFEMATHNALGLMANWELLMLVLAIPHGVQESLPF